MCGSGSKSRSAIGNVNAFPEPRGSPCGPLCCICPRIVCCPCRCICVHADSFNSQIVMEWIAARQSWMRSRLLIYRPCMLMVTEPSGARSCYLTANLSGADRKPALNANLSCPEAILIYSVVFKALFDRTCQMRSVWSEPDFNTMTDV